MFKHSKYIYFFKKSSVIVLLLPVPWQCLCTLGCVWALLFESKCFEILIVLEYSCGMYVCNDVYNFT